MTQDTPKTSGDTLIEKLEAAKTGEQTPVHMLIDKAYDNAIAIIRQHEAQQEVLKYRGSCDAPGFDACVEGEKKQALEEITDAEMDDDDPIDDAYANGYADGYRAKAISIRQEAVQGRICIGGRWFVAEDAQEVIPLEKWTHEDGNVLWWFFPVVEPPYCGTPNDTDFYCENGCCSYTHFTRLTAPPAPKTEGCK